MALGLLTGSSYLVTGLLPVSAWAPVVCVALSGISCAAAVHVGVRRHRPSYRLPWYLIAAAFLSSMTGSLVVFVPTALGFDVPEYGPPDVFFLLQYALLAVPPLLWMRRMGAIRDAVAWIDVATIVVALGTLSWLFLVVPVLRAPGTPPAGAFFAAAYTSCDLLVFGSCLRIVFAVGRRVPVLALMGAGLGCILLADTLDAMSFTHFQVNEQLDLVGALFQAAAPVVGAAALHPSMTALQHRAPSDRTRISGRRLPLLGLSLAVGPVALSVGHVLGDDEFVLVYAAAGVVLSVLVMTRMWLMIKQQRWIAVTDSLTGLRTRRYFEEALATAVARNARTAEPFGLLLLDIDHFKRVNDTRGHGAGDQVLQELGRRLTSLVRAGDVVARYGGEEFAVLLTPASLDDTRTTADRVRAAIAAQPVAVGSDPPLPITVSIGVTASAPPGVPDTSAALMQQADHYLYVAKEHGRDQVAAPPVRSPEPA